MGVEFDLLVVGGGVNGAGIARDAAGRGLRVLLVEQGDLAEFTSSASTKLIHGGLRYLERFELRLVREALGERARLLALAPHLIRPLRFVLPLAAGSRPAWQLGLGLWLYDHLARRGGLAGSRALRLAGTACGAALRHGIRRGFAYSDCVVDDSRLVVLNAVDAAARGAAIRTRTRLVSARRLAGSWRAELEGPDGSRREIAAQGIINAAGPWVSSVLREALGIESAGHLRLVKGSHIVVPRLHLGEHAYLLQNPDRRVVFAIPYEGAFTLIGTTDIAHAGPPGRVAIDPAETRYLCDSVNRWLRNPIAPEHVVWSYAGVRPLFDDAAADPAAVTRDYVLELDAPRGGAPLLSVLGGKITTYRRLAEHALDRLAAHLPPMASPWTGRTPLPGGDLPGGDLARFESAVAARWPFLGAALARRLARAYGTRVERLLGDATTLGALGEDLGGGLTRAEVDHLVAEEFAQTAEDILWRRSKLGLHVPAETAGRLRRLLGEPAGRSGP